MKIGKKNVVSPDPLNYNIGLIGEGGIGKTTIIKKFCEKNLTDLDDPTDGYLFLEVGREDGADAISGINYVTVPKWSQSYDEDSNTIGFKNLVEDITENKDSDYPDLKVIVVDTYDELRRLAEQEVIRQHNIANPQKKIKSINAAFGGYGKGEKMADDITLEYLWQLKSVGVHFIIIGHTKMRNAEDIMSEEKYSQLTTDMPLGSFNKIKTKLHFLGVAYKDRTFKDGKEGESKKISSETRKINFRDDNYSVDSKSRFADIEAEIDFDVDELDRVIKAAIQKEIEKDGKSADQREKDQKAKKEATENSEKKAKKEAKENKVDEEQNQKIIDEIMTAFSGFSDEEKKEKAALLKEIKSSHGFDTFKDLVDRSTTEVIAIKDKVLA